MGHGDSFVSSLLGTKLYALEVTAALSRPTPGWDTAPLPLGGHPCVPARRDPAGHGRGLSRPPASPPAAGQSAGGAPGGSGHPQRTLQSGQAGPGPEVPSLLLCLHSAETTAPLSGLFAWGRTLGFGHSKYKCTQRNRRVAEILVKIEPSRKGKVTFQQISFKY